MLVRFEVELLEPVVLARVTPKDVNFMLRRAMEWYAKRKGLKLTAELDFEPIEGELREFKARSFPDGKRKSVKALRRGVAEVKARISNVEAAMILNDPHGPLRFFKKACHETKMLLKRLASMNLIRRYAIPCELTNFALGFLLPPAFLGKREERIRLWRDERGFRHVFGPARVSITLRMIPWKSPSWSRKCRSTP